MDLNQEKSSNFPEKASSINKCYSSEINFIPKLTSDHIKNKGISHSNENLLLPSANLATKPYNPFDELQIPLKLLNSKETTIYSDLLELDSPNSNLIPSTEGLKNYKPLKLENFPIEEEQNSIRRVSGNGRYINPIIVKNPFITQNINFHYA